MKNFFSFRPIWFIHGKYDLASNFISGNLAPCSLVKAVTQVLLNHVSLPFPSSQLIWSQGSNPGLGWLYTHEIMRFILPFSFVLKYIVVCTEIGLESL